MTRPAAVDYRATIHSCYAGSVTLAIVGNLAPLLFVLFNRKFSLSMTELGTLIVLNFGTQLVLDLLATRYADRVGYRRCIVGAHAATFIGLICLGTLPRLIDPMTGLVVAVVLCGMGGGLLEVLITPIIDAASSEKKTSAIALLHSAYCWGQVLVVLLSTLMLRLLGDELWYFLPYAWALLPLLNGLRFLRLPIPTPAMGEKSMPVRALLGSGLFWGFLVVIFCAGASELAMSQWSSLFAEQGLGVDKTVGDLLGPCLFGVLMGVGRTLFGLFGERLDLRRLLSVSAGFAALCYLLAALADNPYLALAGCALCGLGVAILWPGVCSFASSCFPAGGTAMFGLLAVSGDMGGAAIPWLTGRIADVTSMETGLLCALVCPLLMSAVCLFGLRQKK